MLSKVTAKNVGDVIFWDTTVATDTLFKAKLIISCWEKIFKFTKMEYSKTFDNIELIAMPLKSLHDNGLLRWFIIFGRGTI